MLQGYLCIQTILANCQCIRSSHDRMMDVSSPEPMIYFNRGRYEQNRGDLHAALADFDHGIALGNATRSSA